jgi:hypothetical protein
MKETYGKCFEVIHIYEMRSRKNKLSIDHNKYTIYEEKGLKDRAKKNILINPKVEFDECVNEILKKWKQYFLLKYFYFNVKILK